MNVSPQSSLVEIDSCLTSPAPDSLTSPQREAERAPDIHVARQFLTLLDPTGQFTFQTFDDTSRKQSDLSRVFNGSFETATDSLCFFANEGAGVFMTVNETNLEGRAIANITRVRAVFVDLDGAPLDAVQEFHLKPHIVVESSPGRWHAYWLVGEFPLEHFTSIQKAIAARFGGDPKVCDLSRVMRLPGFFHRKGEPVMTAILESHPDLPRYSLAAILEAFPTNTSSETRHERDSSSGQIGAHADGEAIHVGDRNDQLTSIAGDLRRAGMTPPAIEAKLLELNATVCALPLEPEEVSRIASSIGRYPGGITDIEQSMTDVGNAERFAQRWGREVRYVHGSGLWMLWDGDLWVADGAGAVIEKAKNTAKGIFGEVEKIAEKNPDLAIRMSKHGKASLHQARLQAMVKLAQSRPPIPVGADAFDTNDLLLGVKGGVIDLNSGLYSKSIASHYITKQVPVGFDPSAKCPDFEKFLSQIMGGNVDLIAFLKRAVGYSLTGTTREQCLFFLHGSGANGKSTFLNVMRELLGQYAMQAAPDTLVARKPTGGATSDVARLRGARLVLSSEVEDGSRLAETLVKQMTGGDVVTARAIWKDFSEFTPKFKLWIAGNHKPIIKGDDYAIWRRIRIIPFTVTIPEADRDPCLGDKLRKELPGILNWALAGCKEWLKHGLNPPAEVIAAVKEYRSDMDLIGQWFDERCEKEMGKTLAATGAYGDYKRWAENSGHHPITRSQFGRKMTNRGYDRVHGRAGDSYKDIRLTDAAEFRAMCLPA